MARRGLGPADWLVLAVTPALLTSLASCLLFFIVDILYEGRHGGRMEWILFFGTMGMVLIGRIRLIDEIARKAGLYSAALGGLVWAGLAIYIEPPDGWHRAAHIAVMGALVATGFWVTRLLVADTTDLDDDDEVEGQGLRRPAASRMIPRNGCGTRWKAPQAGKAGRHPTSETVSASRPAARS